MIKSDFSDTYATYSKAARALILRERYLMQLAIIQAQLAERCGEVPVGAVLVTSKDLWMSFNAPIATNDPTNHAEIRVLRKTAQIIKNYRLTGAEIFCTLEPCNMCLEAMKQARIKRVVFGCSALKQPNLKLETKAAHLSLESACAKVLQDFFKIRR